MTEHDHERAVEMFGECPTCVVRSGTEQDDGRPLDALLDRPAPVTPARATDPSTSTIAAAAMRWRAGSDRVAIGDVFYEHPEGLTAFEAMDLAGLDAASGAWHRASDLKHAGILVPTGRRRPRKDRPSGPPANVLTMTDAGRAWWRGRFRT